MNEHETHPERPSVPREGEQPRVEGDGPVSSVSAESDQPLTVDGGGDRPTPSTPFTAAEPGPTAPPAATPPAIPAPPVASAPPVTSALPAGSPEPWQSPGGAPDPTRQHSPGWPGHPDQSGQPVYGYPGQSGQPVHGYPGPYPPPAGMPVPPSPYGAPVPPWAQPAPPSRLGRIAVAGAAALALMLGSGVAGGFAALALDGGSAGGRTYTAAPIINSADLPGIAARVMDSVVSITTDNGEGSGVVLSADGYVLTNNHVVASAGSDTVKVVFADGKTALAKIIGTDPKTDLAVIRAEGVSGLRPANFGDSDAMRVGDTVLALGSPLGLQGSVTAGIISARDRIIQTGGEEPGGSEPGSREGVSSISGLLQTDAPINPGNSGGALINTRGEVIGINTAIATAGTGNGNIGVGFAIPSNKAKDVAEKLQKGEKVSHPSLGVSVTNAEKGGALISGVKPDSPADQVGLEEGDVITRFGEKVINGSNDLVAAVQAGRVGDRVELTYTRNGVEERATVTLAETS